MVSKMELWECKICGTREFIDIDKPVREIEWEEVIIESGYEHYCPKCRDEREFQCDICDKKWKRKELIYRPEVEGDELNVYVVYRGYTPCCYETAEIQPGYITDPVEPLRHED